MLLFLYFRRHYKSYQQRRARRMRRLKDALGMGPEAHGIMFNGLDGEEPDWQIMPMPVREDAARRERGLEGSHGRGFGKAAWLEADGVHVPRGAHGSCKQRCLTSPCGSSYIVGCAWRPVQKLDTRPLGSLTRLRVLPYLPCSLRGRAGWIRGGRARAGAAHAPGLQHTQPDQGH